MGKPIAAGMAGHTTAAPTADFERDLVALMPQLRSFSRAQCRNRTLAEDMVQQALMKAWRSQDSFTLGTNLKAWLFTILRHEFYSHGRRAWREAHWDAAASERIPSAPNAQGWAVELSDTARALSILPQAQREALLLVSAGGFSFRDTAEFCGTPVGTVKSRVTRARIGLLKVLDQGRILPPRETRPRHTASSDIMAQLSALMPVAAGGSAPAIHATASA